MVNKLVYLNLGKVDLIIIKKRNINNTFNKSIAKPIKLKKRMDNKIE